MRRVVASSLPHLGAALTLALAGAPLVAQDPHAGGVFIVRLGHDTIAVEQFTRSRSGLSGRLLDRYYHPRTELIEYSATFAPGGTIASFEISARPAARPDSAPLWAARTRL